MVSLNFLLVLSGLSVASCRNHYHHRRQTEGSPAPQMSVAPVQTPMLSALPPQAPAVSTDMSSNPIKIQYQPIVYVPYVPLVDSCQKKKTDEQKNKRLVRRFTQELFGEKNISCINHFVAPGYIQHNPTVADGRESLITAAHEWFKDDKTKNRVDIKRISADGNLVWVHYKDKTEDGKLMAIVDIYRVENGKIQEHWDVMQVLVEPEKAKNEHPLF